MQKVIPLFVMAGAVMVLLIWATLWLRERHEHATTTALVSQMLRAQEDAVRHKDDLDARSIASDGMVHSFDITTLDLSGIAFRIPLKLSSSSTLYHVGDTVRFMYDYPPALAGRESNEIFCDDATAARHVVTEVYLLNDESGMVVGIPYLEEPSGIDPGKHALLWNTKTLYEDAGLDVLPTTTPAGRYRLLIVSRLPSADPKPTCESNKRQHGPVEWIDSWIGYGRSLEEATDTLRGFGYSEALILK